MRKKLFIVAMCVDSELFGYEPDQHDIAQYLTSLQDDGIGPVIVWSSPEAMIEDHQKDGPITAEYVACQPPIIATFHPQAWVNDNAIDVDPEGPTEFDVTEHVVGMGRETALAIEDGRDSSDALRDLPGAPDWIRNWPGPFRVEVAGSIRNYFGED